MRLIQLISLFFAAFLFVAGQAFALAGPPQQERIIIAAPKPYTELVSQIQRLGGRVKHQYEYVDAVAAEIPVEALPALRYMVGPAAISKDATIPRPGIPNNPRQSATRKDLGSFVTAPVGDAERIFPRTVPPENAYRLNYADLNVRELHVRGKNGDGVIVAVIDSGVRPGYPGLDLDRSVIGGENFVPDPETGVVNPALFRDASNDPHGTFVATLISGNAKFELPEPSELKASLNQHISGVATGNELFFFGAAPLARIFAVRVFGADALSGAPKSRVMAAMERVIKLREMYDRDHPRGLNIQVCNISLGTSTIFAGRTEFERLIDEMLRKGIVPVVSGGNVGPSTLTVASPGSSFSAVTVGALSRAGNERVFRDLQFGLGAGVAYRASMHTQTAWFSSRGPNADGRGDPDVMASGFGNFGQGYGAPDTIDISSGTSFSAPIVAGIAALLRQAFPEASATQIRNAIAESANPSIIRDGSTELDRGRGVADAGAAFRLLRSGRAPDSIPRPERPNSHVRVNVEQNTELRVNHGFVRESFRNLKPGQRGEILYEVTAKTTQVVVEIGNVQPSLPPSQQNPLFGDDIFLNIHSAKTSSIGPFGDYPAFAFTVGGTFVVDDPEPGIMRITLLGDWTNAGTISADVTVSATKDPLPRVTAQGEIHHLELIEIPVRIRPDVSVAEFQLEWREDWGKYPANDIDLFFVNPAGSLNQVDGATLRNPEKVRIENPQPGIWRFYIFGFNVLTERDAFELRIALDGKVVKQ